MVNATTRISSPAVLSSHRIEAMPCVDAMVAIVRYLRAMFLISPPQEYCDYRKLSAAAANVAANETVPMISRTQPFLGGLPPAPFMDPSGRPDLLPSLPRIFG